MESTRVLMRRKKSVGKNSKEPFSVQNFSIGDGVTSVPLLFKPLRKLRAIQLNLFSIECTATPLNLCVSFFSLRRLSCARFNSNEN